MAIHRHHLIRNSELLLSIFVQFSGLSELLTAVCGQPMHSIASCIFHGNSASSTKLQQLSNRIERSPFTRNNLNLNALKILCFWIRKALENNVPVEWSNTWI
ncbi:hypothetical protein BZA77DRAFT_301798, partial [Pyronema omphalodes]